MLNTKKVIVDNVEFLMDVEGWKKFILEFDSDKHTNRVIDGYLHRMNKQGEKNSFHRFLLNKEIAEFAEKHKVEIDEVEVDHKNGNKADDRRENLQIIVQEK